MAYSTVQEKFPISEDLASQLLSSGLLTPEGFLSCYTGKENDFISMHSEEGKLLKELKDKVDVLSSAGQQWEELKEKIELAGNACKLKFLSDVFAYLAKKTDCIDGKEVKENYFKTCCYLQDLRDYILQHVVPRLKTEEKFDSSHSYNYTAILSLDGLIFDKIDAYRIRVKIEKLLR